MNDVFISYSRRDKVFTQKLYESLTAANRSVWADWDDIPAASDWFAEIKQGIEETDSVIFVLSPEWIKSNECRKEMDYAVKMGKRLFPIMYLPVDPRDVPPELGKINWVYLRDGDDFEKGFQTLCSAMDTDLDWIKTHTRIQVRALEWEKKNRSASFALRGEDLTEGEKFIAGAANKTPVPTALQSEYILASRKDATRRQRQTLAAVTIALIISIALAVATFIQSQKAVKQSQIALARQLAAQAQSIYAGRSSNQMVAVLLSIQSMKLFPNNDAATFLVNHNLSAPFVSRMAHTGPVRAASFSPDGRYVVSGSDDKTARVWETTTGIEIVRLSHEGVVKAVAFSPDGKYVASGSEDDTIRIWEAATGKEIIHKTHKGAVNCVAFSLDGKYVVSGSEDKTVRVWDVITGKEVARLSHDDAIYSVTFSPNGKYIVSRGNYTVEIWETVTGKKLTSIPQDGLTSESLSPDSKYVAIGCVTCSARVFEMMTGNEVASLTNGVSVTPVVFSPNGNYIVSGNDVWDTTTWKIISSFDQDDGADTIVFSPDSKYFVSAGNSTVRVREVNTGKEIARMTHDGPVTSVAFSPDGKYVLSGSEDNTIRIWKAISTQVSQKTASLWGNRIILSPDGQDVASFVRVNNASIWELATGNTISNITYGDQAFALSFSPDGKLAASGGDDGTVRIWGITTGKEIAYMHHTGPVKTINFSPNGKYVVSGSEDKTASVWDVTTGKKVSQRAHDSAVTIVVFSPDSHYVASGSDDGIVRLWDPITGNEKTHMKLEGQVSEVSFVPNGNYLVASGIYVHTLHVLEISTNKQVVFRPHAPLNYDDRSWVIVYLSSDSRYIASLDINNANYAIIWEITTGQEVSRIAQNGISSIAFSPDGNYVASGGSDGTVRLGETATGKGITTMTHDGPVTSVAFSPDGKYVASASSDRTARVWDVTSGKEIVRLTDDDIVGWITFSRDGKYLVSASLHDTIRAWTWRSEDLIVNACDVMPRNLTRAEWEHYIGDAMLYPTSQEKATCPNLPIPSEQTATPKAMP